MLVPGSVITNIPIEVMFHLPGLINDENSDR